MKKAALLWTALATSAALFLGAGPLRADGSRTPPGGSNGSVQYNQQGGFAGGTDLTYSTPSKTLSAPQVSVTTLTVNGQTYYWPSTTTAGCLQITSANVVFFGSCGGGASVDQVNSTQTYVLGRLSAFQDSVNAATPTYLTASSAAATYPQNGGFASFSSATVGQLASNGTVTFVTSPTFNTGILTQATIVNDPSSGATAWTIPGSLAGLADTITGFGSHSYYLRFSSYNANIPADAVITGVQVTLSRKNSINGSGHDEVVSLLKNGAIQGDNKATSTNWTNAQVDAVYGSSTDLWGLALTPADVNSSGFGLTLKVQGPGTGDAQALGFYPIVYYTVPNWIAGVKDGRFTLSYSTIGGQVDIFQTDGASTSIRGRLQVGSTIYAQTIVWPDGSVSTTAVVASGGAGTDWSGPINSSVTAVMQQITATHTQITAEIAVATAGHISGSSVATTYESISDAVRDYLTKSSASGNYMLIVSSGGFLSISSASLTYQSIADAAALFLTKSSASGNYMLIVSSRNFLTTSSAGLTYLQIADAAGLYLTLSSGAATYTPIGGVASFSSGTVTNGWTVTSGSATAKGFVIPSGSGAGVKYADGTIQYTASTNFDPSAIAAATTTIFNALVNISSSVSAGGGGGVKSLYFRNSLDASLSSTYNMMLSTPSTAAEGTQSASVASANGLVLVASFTTIVSGLGLDVNLIPSGFFQFTMFAQIDSFVGTTNLVLDLSTMSKTGTNITKIVSSTITNVNSTSYQPYLSESVLASDVSISTDDRVLVKVYAITTSAIARTVTIITDGSNRDSRIGTTVERNPTLISLNDVSPQSYAGKAAQFVQVNAGETGVTFAAVVQAADFQNLPKQGSTGYVQIFTTGSAIGLDNSTPTFRMVKTSSLQMQNNGCITWGDGTVQCTSPTAAGAAAGSNATLTSPATGPYDLNGYAILRSSSANLGNIVSTGPTFSIIMPGGASVTVNQNGNLSFGATEYETLGFPYFVGVATAIINVGTSATGGANGGRWISDGLLSTASFNSALYWWHVPADYVSGGTMSFKLGTTSTGTTTQQESWVLSVASAGISATISTPTATASNFSAPVVLNITGTTGSTGGTRKSASWTAMNGATNVFQPDTDVALLIVRDGANATNDPDNSQSIPVSLAILYPKKN